MTLSSPTEGGAEQEQRGNRRESKEQIQEITQAQQSLTALPFPFWGLISLLISGEIIGSIFPESLHCRASHNPFLSSVLLILGMVSKTHHYFNFFVVGSRFEIHCKCQEGKHRL